MYSITMSPARKFRGWLWLLVMVATLAGCVPAQTPPQLAATPGSAVVVSGSRYVSEAFSLTMPGGWRAITSPANESVFVTLAAPDHCTVIVVSVEPQPVPEPAACEGAAMREATHSIDGTPVIYVVMLAPVDGWDDAEATFMAVVESVRT